jgi:hypothetical protein
MIVAGSWFVSTTLGQVHRDTQFSYIDGRIEVQPPERSSELVFESNFPTSGIEQQFATLPGFASEVDVGLGIGASDQIVYNVLDNLLYWDGTEFDTPPSGIEIRIRNNPPSVPDTLVGADSGPQPGRFSPPANRIGAAGSAGDFHVDLQWFLEPNSFPAPPPPPDFGAYGVLLSLSTDAPGIADSERFLYVFNFGLDSETFAQAVTAFTALLAPGLAGDYNGNGIVDAADYVVWRNLFGQTGPGLAADGNGDLQVNEADYEFWRARFGNHSGGDSSIGVPEPMSVVLAFVASVFLFFYPGEM